MYIPQITLEEGFWFIKNFMPDLMVSKLGNNKINAQFKNIDYPANHGQIKLCVDTTIDERELIIEKDKFGYIRIIY
jgi:hypothetical protein